MTASQWILLAAAVVIASNAAAEGVTLCGGPRNAIGDGGRLLNHFPYVIGARAELVRPPRALRGQCEAIHGDMRADLEALLARAHADPEVGPAIVAVSCFRSRQHQARIFCRQGRSTLPLVQAYQVAPPGFSEHATGRVIDFGDRRGTCKLVACFAKTAVGRWLARNAPDFGFEMSFPQGNRQGVAFEPWHWRWIGRDDSDRSVGARTIFAAARERFPTVEPVDDARIEFADLTPFAGPLAAQLLTPSTKAATGHAMPALAAASTAGVAAGARASGTASTSSSQAEARH